MKGNTSVSLGPHFEQYINEKVAEGSYKNASEVIRSALRLLEDEEKRKYTEWAAWVTAELEKGEASGPAREVDFEEMLLKFKADRAARLKKEGNIKNPDCPPVRRS